MSTEAWGTDSGLTSKFTGTVEDAFFDYNPDYRDGEIPLLHLELVDLTSDEDGFGLDITTETYSTGKNWEVVDDGQAVERSDGKTNAKFHESTKLGLLIDALIEVGAVADLAEAGDPNEAKAYKGLRITFERTQKNYGVINGEEVTSSYMRPVEYHGVQGGAAKSNGNGAGNRKKLEAKLKAIAKKADDHDDFMAQALDVDGVTDDDGLFDQVTDDSDAGFYAQAVA